MAGRSDWKGHVKRLERATAMQAQSRIWVEQGCRKEQRVSVVMAQERLGDSEVDTCSYRITVCGTAA